MNTTEQLLPLMHDFNAVIMIFAVTVMSSYIILAAISTSALKEYFRRNRFVRYNSLLALPDAPSISLIAPAYNEGKTIQENVHSLLSINYNNFNVIVVNDGSKDNSMEVLTKAFDLILSDVAYIDTVPTKMVKGIYVSSNPSYGRLIVVDKENGGKADALNTGINVARNPYVVCIDVDCIMDKDVLLKLAKPFLESSCKRVIATGGVVRIANSCVIKSGKLVSVHAPDNLLARIQVLEYLRAFMLGRMAWAKMDGLLLISGAFGMFDREIVLACGGYNTQTVGEDMELVVRMRRYMIEQKQPYTVQYIPDPLCWTEAPESYKILIKQRSRWTRGTFETLLLHRKIFMNPKYGILGMLSYPYWMLYEYWAPIIEFIGLIITIIFACSGILNWTFFGLLLIFSYIFAVGFSLLAIYVEESTFKRYNTFKDLRKLLLAALIEPIIFHPVTVYAALKGNWEKIKGKNGWGDMTRKGFEKKTI
ncbi:glycosyltransferase family 2 protein [Edaphocola flava]|jgi:cellulose synthase/poly-beta-1,6-N-acetylglucosamine synthase-like glycosyltransferase|uniref:glycosyltransferase family 2 protein n=1 Tax=Edaphocola flava TaxID=2499629 RepID=UPI00192A25F8|nr:glycosyltransferase family 2 protein [Edaphocola flava]